MKFYRYEAIQYASVGIDGDYESPSYPNPHLQLIELKLFKETDKGYWIGHGWQKPVNLRSEAKWVSKTARKRYAYPSKEEALINYIKRTERRIRILQYQLTCCKIGLNKAGRQLDTLKLQNV